jgi:hypothetical protein
MLLTVGMEATTSSASCMDRHAPLLQMTALATRELMRPIVPMSMPLRYANRRPAVYASPAPHVSTGVSVIQNGATICHTTPTLSPIRWNDAPLLGNIYTDHVKQLECMS